MAGKIKSVKSKYKCVQGILIVKTGETKWVVNISGVGRNRFKTEKEAAIAVDKYLISKRKAPVNVLVHIQTRVNFK